MNLKGIHTASHTDSEKPAAFIRFCTFAFFLFAFAHAGIQLSFAGTHSFGELLGIHEQPGQVHGFLQPVHHSPQHSSTLPVAEFLKENEVEEKSSFYKIQYFYATFDLVKHAHIGKSENLYHGFLQSLQNRPTLSLFLLHHSWKSYLS